MVRSKLAPVFAILLALTLFFSGMLTYKLLSGRTAALPGQLAVLRHTSAGQSDRVGIQGRVLIQAYHANGALFTTWKGHNALTVTAINAIAGCASGLTTAPIGFGACSSWTAWIKVTAPNIFFAGQATNTLNPTGCALCTGWQSTATIAIPDSIALGQAFAEDASGTHFDEVSISPAIAVNPGDRVVVTITFTVS